MDPLLLPNTMAVPVYVAEEVAVGRCVFQNFVHQEFVEEGMPDDEILEEVPEENLVAQCGPASRYVDENFANALDHVGASGYNAPLVILEIGTSIRELANEFALSQERKRLKKEADKVDVGTITHEGFFALCNEVFRDGMTRERVIALFYFCADVLKKCVRSSMKDIAIQLFKWALEFIVDCVCAWVAKQGGWEKAIKNTVSKTQLVVMGAAAVGVFAVSGFILYKMRP